MFRAVLKHEPNNRIDPFNDFDETKYFMRTTIIVLLLLLAACTVLPPTQDAVPSPTEIPHSGPPYPRLGIWWPNLYEQPLEKAARYDWVILGKWQKDFLGPLSQLNPNLQLLIATNACEVDFNPDDPSANTDLQAIPPEWYLTQVGTNLRENVDASQIIIPVAAVRVGNINLFVAGDTALIEGESVYIESVDENSLTLTVRRGYIRPAAPHQAGTRIAAHISFWSNSWMLNVSTLSPRGVSDPTIGPERWIDYNARSGAKLLADSRWAGIFVDRAGQNQSWLIGNSTARSIDPDQSNRLITDYSAFDAAWNEGLLSYLNQLRTAIGPKPIIFLNGGIPQYTTVNGSDFEGFPSDQNAQRWHVGMFGPNPTGSYFDWLAIPRQPNLTTIGTYEDDSFPQLGAGKYRNRCNEPTFIPNYRKMRFGLTSALLNNGYFSYEMNTAGHSSLCLMWFDEYDNAGSGRGYLGYPLGNAQRSISSLTTANQIKFGKFESKEDLSTWLSRPTDKTFTVNLDALNPATGTFSAHLQTQPPTDKNSWHATFSYAPIQVIKDKEYTLTFYARAEKPREISVWAEQDSDPWHSRLNFGQFSLTTTWQKFEMPVTAEADDPRARLVFGLGSDTSSVWLDEIALQEGNPDVWRRDYENGIVIVNATANEVTIPLESVYIKINGLQDRTVNDGSLVSKVTIAPHDGIILLRKNKQ